MARHWLNRWLRSSPGGDRLTPPKRHRRSILAIEALEDRIVPSFAAPTAIDLGAAPNAVAVGHFEGTANPPDVVTANANGTVSVLLGTVTGTVQNPITLTVGGSPDAVAVGDLLGNGRDDIVAANANGTVDVLLSNGNGTFQAAQSFSVGATPEGVALGDFNGDGKLDIVTANANGTVSVLLGKGNGTFGTAIRSTASGSLTSIAVGEFNGDHKADVVVGTNTGVDVLLGNGNGTFRLNQQITFSRKIDRCFTETFSVSSVAVSDLRHDGKQDVVALDNVGEVNILLGNGNGTLANPVVAPGSLGGTGSFVVGDFTGDGIPDIATSSAPAYSGAPTLTVLVGKGDGTFKAGTAQTIGESATSLAAGNFSSGGNLDLVMATNLASNTVTLVAGKGNGTFTLAPTVATGGLNYSIAAGVFTSSGKPDLVTAGANGITLLVNNGNGTFHTGSTIFSGFATEVVVGDFNGDGKEDIAALTAPGTVSVFLGNGNGTFQAAKNFTFPIGDNLHNLAVGNFVKGGLPDLVVTDWMPNGKGVVTVLLNQGKGTFVKGQSIDVGTDPLGLSIADFNGDGNLDVATITDTSGSGRDIQVLLGNGNGTFQAPITTATTFAPGFLAAGDFNGDGKPDLVLVDYFSGDNSVLVMQGNGNGTFKAPTVYKFQSLLGFATPVVGDFFGDGKQSIALATSQGQVSIMRGNGDGTFQAPVNSLMDFVGSQPNSLVAADFNGDGKLDLAATATIDGTVSILLNNSPALSHAAPVATTTTLTSDANTAVFGQPVNLTATVTAASGAATGSVTFFDGSMLLGVVGLDPNGQARLQVELAPGPHALRAVFGGIAPFSTSTSATLTETVNKDHTTTALTVDTSTFGVGFVSLTATIVPVAPGSGTPTGTVTFFEGTKVLGTVQLTGGQAILDLERTLPAGNHRVHAVYSGDGDFVGSTSTDVTFTIR
jgi:hypothetical protein